MKLNTFNAENTRVVRNGSPAIGVNQKTGLFNLNKYATDFLEMKNGDLIVFHQDEESPENWYLEIVGKDGFQCGAKNNITAGLLFNNTAMARSIAGAFNIEGSYRMLIAGEPTKFGKRVLHGLIIREN